MRYDHVDVAAVSLLDYALVCTSESSENATRISYPNVPVSPQWHTQQATEELGTVLTRKCWSRMDVWHEGGQR